MNVYEDIKYYFEKYFEMVVFLLFFFLPIVLLPRRLCLFRLILPRGTRNMSTSAIYHQCLGPFDITPPSPSALLACPDFATWHQKQSASRTLIHFNSLVSLCDGDCGPFRHCSSSTVGFTCIPILPSGVKKHAVLTQLESLLHILI